MEPKHGKLDILEIIAFLLYSFNIKFLVTVLFLEWPQDQIHKQI